jgi:DNA-binding NtrC family response regulator
VVITDGVMPGINGLEMARLMKEKNPLVPIILLSGMPDRFADPTVFETTFQKPFSTPDVLSSIEQAVAGPSRCSSGTSKPKDHQVPGQQSRPAQNHSGPASDCRLAWASESNSRVVPQAAHFGEMLTY